MFSSKTNVQWDESHEMVDGEDTIILSKECVMKSAAGYYVGTACKTIKSNEDWKIGMIEPYSRDSHYMGTHEEVEAFIECCN